MLFQEFCRQEAFGEHLVSCSSSALETEEDALSSSMKEKQKYADRYTTVIKYGKATWYYKVCGIARWLHNCSTWHIPYPNFFLN